MRKRIDHWGHRDGPVVPEKSQTSGPPLSGILGKPRFSTGTMSPRVGIFLSPLETNDGFYLFHMGKIAKIPIWCAKKKKRKSLTYHFHCLHSVTKIATTDFHYAILFANDANYF